MSMKYSGQMMAAGGSMPSIRGASIGHQRTKTLRPLLVILEPISRIAILYIIYSYHFL